MGPVLSRGRSGNDVIYRYLLVIFINTIPGSMGTMFFRKYNSHIDQIMSSLEVNRSIKVPLYHYNLNSMRSQML